MPMYASEFNFFHATSLSGVRWILITANGRSVWISNEDVFRNPAMLLRILAQKGMPVTEKEAAKTIMSRYAEAKPYDATPPIDHPGWSLPFFAWPDGRICGPQGVAKPVIVYELNEQMFQCHGSTEGWLNGIFKPLRRDPLFVFVLLLPLAAFLRAHLDPADHQIVEVVASQVDLSTLNDVVASVTGGVEERGAYQAISFLHALSLTEGPDPHRDHLLLVRDALAHFATQSGKRRADDTARLLLKETLTRSRPKVPSRSMLMIDQQRLVESVGEETGLGQILFQRVLTVKVPPGRRHGLFARLPKGMRFAFEFTNQLREAASENRGWLAHRFVERLVQEVADDQPRLIRKIERHRAEFRRYSNVNMRDHAAVRVVDVFGLVYAAGRFAREWGLLPATSRFRTRLLRCYSRFYLAPPSRLPFGEELQKLLITPGVLHIGVGHPKPKPELVKKAEIVAQHTASHVDILIKPGVLNRYVVNGSRRLNDVDVVERLQRDGKHMKVKRPNFSPDRVYVFRLTLDELAEGASPT